MSPVRESMCFVGQIKEQSMRFANSQLSLFPYQIIPSTRSFLCLPYRKEIADRAIVDDTVKVCVTQVQSSWCHVSIGLLVSWGSSQVIRACLISEIFCEIRW
jgi:hypothetical protein